MASLFGRSGGPEQVPGWALSAGDILDRAFMVVALSIAWLLLAVLGLVVLGVAPATSAVSDVLRARRREEHVPILRGVWAGYRRDFIGSNARMLPLLVVQAGAGATIRIGTYDPGSQVTAVVLVAIGGIVLAWSTASLAALAACPRLRRQDVRMTWRLALLMPGALPGWSILTLVVVAVWTVIALVIPVLGFLLGAGLALELAGMILGKRVEKLLAEVDSSPQEQPEQ